MLEKFFTEDRMIVKAATSFFGRIDYDSLTIPVPGIYKVNGGNQSGYIVDMERSQFNCSLLAIEYCQAIGHYLFFGEDHSLIVRHEILRRLKTDLENNSFLQKYLDDEIEECLQIGRLDFPEILGEYPPPVQTPIGFVTQSRRISNGVYLVDSTISFFASDDTEWMIAFNESIIETYVSTTAARMGRSDRGYLFYDLLSAAAPLYELRNKYSEIKDSVDMGIVITVLNSKLPEYTLCFNRLASEEEAIPTVEVREDNLNYLKIQNQE